MSEGFLPNLVLEELGKLPFRISGNTLDVSTLLSMYATARCPGLVIRCESGKIQVRRVQFRRWVAKNCTKFIQRLPPRYLIDFQPDFTAPGAVIYGELPGISIGGVLEDVHDAVSAHNAKWPGLEDKLLFICPSE